MKFLETYNNFEVQSEKPSYGDFMTSGVDHDIYHIDDFFILKRPANWSEGRTKEDLTNFKNHINFMKKFPTIFADTKLLDPTRASIEKLNTEKAIKEINYVAKYLKLYLNDKTIDDRFLLNIYNSKQLIKKGEWYYNTTPQKLKEIFSKLSFPIVKKWYNFYKKLLLTLKNVDIPNMHSLFNKGYLDCHAHNIGLDKEGNPKLLDF